jgi:pantoate--beta-alanine ligase
MQVIKSPERMQQIVRGCKQAGDVIALVPTMGALHAGHASLIERALKMADVVIVSIYVNPSQFGPKEDFSRYPRPFAQDAAICGGLGVDYIFAPRQLYAPDHSTWVNEEELSLGRCGRSREGHFRGVTTVVAKLFNIAQPDLALFGQKDAQQCDVIRRMVRDMNIPVRLVVVPTLREKDGLALSSRNAYLSAEERAFAPEFHRCLVRAARKGQGAGSAAARELVKAGFELDYAEVVGGRLCAAVRLGKTRLIDNVAVTSRPGSK